MNSLLNPCHIEKEILFRLCQRFDKKTSESNKFFRINYCYGSDMSWRFSAVYLEIRHRVYSFYVTDDNLSLTIDQFSARYVIPFVDAIYLDSGLDTSKDGIIATKSLI